MSWNHRICGDCWIRQHFKYHPDGGFEFRPPIQVNNLPPGPCCFCPNVSQLGIFVRQDPKTMTCKHIEDG